MVQRRFLHRHKIERAVGLSCQSTRLQQRLPSAPIVAATKAKTKVSLEAGNLDIEDENNVVLQHHYTLTPKKGGAELFKIQYNCAA